MRDNKEYSAISMDTDSFCDKNVLHEVLQSFTGNDYDKNLLQLRDSMLLSPSKVIDELDSDGNSVLHKTLNYMLENDFKDIRPLDVIELTLYKSYLDYRTYQQGITLALLKKYDESIEPTSIKYLQWQILSREGESLIKNKKRGKEETKFMELIKNTIKDKTYLIDIFESILISGSLELLKYVMKLIDDDRINLPCSIVTIAVKRGKFAKPEHLEHFQECFLYLLKISDKKVLCMADKNIKDMTALRFADQNNDDFMIKSLLFKGAPIAVQDKNKKFPIQKVKFKILKEYLDSLVTLTPTKFLQDDSVWKVINSIFNVEYALDDFIFMDFTSFQYLTENDLTEFKDIEFIEAMSGIPRLCKLIDHPIVATLLELHWMRFKKWIFLDQISVFFILLMFFVFGIKYGVTITEEICHGIDYVGVIFALIFLFGELLKNYKIFELLMAMSSNIFKAVMAKINLLEATPYHTVHHFPMYQIITSVFLKIPLLILIIIYGVHHCDHLDKACNQTIGISLILFSINITLLVAYFSQTVALYVIMFVYVAYNGSKFILSMFLILFGFGLGLFMLITNFKYNIPETEIAANDTTVDDMPAGVIGLSLFRAFVMSTGELEASSFQFNAITSYIVFIFFIFVIPIVFSNLLNGLAIEDIMEIKKEAMFWYRNTQLMVLKEFQQFFIKIDQATPCTLHNFLDITLYPDVIGTKAFIGINSVTREIFAMTALTRNERKLVGRLSRNVLANADEILMDQ